jgi:hypothetical protein
METLEAYVVTTRMHQTGKLSHEETSVSLSSSSVQVLIPEYSFLALLRNLRTKVSSVILATIWLVLFITATGLKTDTLFFFSVGAVRVA